MIKLFVALILRPRFAFSILSRDEIKTCHNRYFVLSYQSAWSHYKLKNFSIVSLKKFANEIKNMYCIKRISLHWGNGTTDTREDKRT